MIRKASRNFGLALALCLAPQGAAGQDSQPVRDEKKNTEAAKTATSCDEESSGRTDCRGTFQASGYTGLAIDSFAAKEVNAYLNPDAQGDLKNRGIFGFNFAYRVAGDDQLTKHTRSFRRVNNLWLYGETLHGVRSADVDCGATPSVPVCAKSLKDLGENIPQQALYMLRNATSLEGYAGFRYEFLGLQQKSSAPANLYIAGQAGFLNVAGLGGDVVDNHKVSIGVVATKGDFQNSYFELGYGRTDLFRVNPNRRVKIDGYLEKRLVHNRSNESIMSLFVQMNVDSDMGRGSDSVQTYVGLNFNLGAIF